MVSKRACKAEGCDIAELFKLLSQTHMLDILHATVTANDGSVRFLELQRRIGLSPNTLSARLKALVEAGIFTRTAYQEIPPRVEYEATAKARDLRIVFDAMIKWSNTHSL